MLVIVGAILMGTANGEETGEVFLAPTGESMADFQAMIAQRAKEHQQARRENKFSKFRDDYFARYVLDDDTTLGTNEVAVTGDWHIQLPADPSETAQLMAGHLAEFLERIMGVHVPVETGESRTNVILLTERNGGDPAVEESFSVRATAERIEIAGRDAAGLRDGIVRLMDRMGFRRAPIVTIGETTYRPRIPVRQGAHGSYRDTVLMGYNAILAGGGSLYAISDSEAIPELKARRNHAAFEGSYSNAAAARRYGMKTYFHMGTQQKFGKDDPVFDAHPEIRGALTWKADGDYVLCTEQPLVKQYISESVEAIFKGDPKLDGITIIIGGEGFYHCYMRPFGVEKGRTNCERCNTFSAEEVVANLCNLVLAAARRVNPDAIVMAWPYSAVHVWSADRAQTGLIERMDPGVTILTEMVKDEYVEKPEGIRKHLWDYSIDMIGPGSRAKEQIAACRKADRSIRILSMAEETFEASLLPHIPCMDRWADRANALATSGADSIYVFQMGPYDASSVAELNKQFWWDPTPDKEAQLKTFATRIAGPKAADSLRLAWGKVSAAIEYTPEIGLYYQGPHYLGPAHPMRVVPTVDPPQVFFGYYLFRAEMTADEAFKGRPTYYDSTRGDAPVYERYYRKMEDLLKEAADAMDQARPNVPEAHRLMFDAEDSAIQWFYRTARTEGNFYESCQIRDRLAELSKQEALTEAEQAEAAERYTRWVAVLEDERENARSAMPLVEADVRLDPYHRGDHSLSHIGDMLTAKLTLLDVELNDTLPSIAKKLGVANPG
jgi:hypothetical protein